VTETHVEKPQISLSKNYDLLTVRTWIRLAIRSGPPFSNAYIRHRLSTNWSSDCWCMAWTRAACYWCLHQWMASKI